jgi:hypothetical protein
MPLNDIISRLICISSESWISQFRKNMDHYFDAILREEFFRVSMEVPKFLDCFKLKIMSSGIYIILDMIELSLGFELSNSFKMSNKYSEIILSVAKICSLLRDIYYFPKEIEYGEPCNLLTSMITYESLSFEDAFDKAIIIHNLEVKNFIQLENETIKFYENNIEKSEIETWFEYLKYSMVGIWHWTLENNKNYFKLNEIKNRVFLDDSSNQIVPL